MQPVGSDLRSERAADTRGPGDVGSTRPKEDGSSEIEVVAGLRENRAALLQRNDLVGLLGVAVRRRDPPRTAGYE